MAKHRKPKVVKLKVSGTESVFEATQAILAALTLIDPSTSILTKQIEEAVSTVLRLEPQTAVMALWLILTATLAGFDTDEDRMVALQLIAVTVARMQPTVDKAFPR